jgi:hypothetical protein
MNCLIFKIKIILSPLKLIFYSIVIHEQLQISSGMGTGGILTTDNLPETTEKLGCPTDNIPDDIILK